MKTKPSKTKKILVVLSVIIVLAVLVFKVYGSAIIKQMWGIRAPRIENALSLLATAKKYKLNTASIVATSPEAYRGLVTEFTGFPEVLVFDKQGRYIEYKAQKKDCNAAVFGFIPGLDKNGTYKMTGKTTLTKVMSGIRDLQGNLLPANFLDPSADFYMLISWTAWTGKLNEDHVYKWQELAAKNTKARIQVIEVNFDAQQWWPKQASDSVLEMYAPQK